MRRCGSGGFRQSSARTPAQPDQADFAGAVKKTRKQPGDAIDNAAKENVRRMVKKIRTCKPLLDKMADKGTLEIVGAFYDLDTGKVELIE